eukprot:gnl/MRDRNA2_/MRDRNA2_90640_c0_seq1.p1 gnl/MRDRNA2_/MRDRNA2_90640_c0~~gnl/MRDRNA2_/MRDRNA2_90640_c0_seq1.p1  ORF type:complete len:399 (+),score=76.72 gnl/MRDRNA2_/MRDRNA2_90640_c0_seq1:136-1332(+)
MILLLTFVAHAHAQVACNSNVLLHKLVNRARTTWCLHMDLDKATLGKVDVWVGAGPKVPVSFVPISVKSLQKQYINRQVAPQRTRRSKIRTVVKQLVRRHIKEVKPRTAMTLRSDNGTRDEEFNVANVNLQTSSLDNPYIDVAFASPPQDMLKDFAKEAPPRVLAATLNTILALLGTVGATTAVESVSIITTERCANLMLQMQLTGYLFKKAEYRLSLSESLSDVHMSSSESPQVMPRIEGKIKVGIGGSKVEVDAEAYMTELRNEVQALRGELAEIQNKEREVAEKDLLAYIGSVPDMDVEQVQKDMSPEVLNAVKTLVGMIVSSMSHGPGALNMRRDLDPGSKLKYLMYLLTGGEKLIRVSSSELSQVCFWQMVIGYRLREIEIRNQLNQTAEPAG